MLFPCGFGVFPRSQPRPQDFGRSYNPYGSFRAEVPKTLVRSALPSAVILDGEHLQPRPFHLLLFRPCRKSVALRKPPDLSLCETRPKRGLFDGLWVSAPPRWETRHTGRHGGSQGDILALLHPHHRGFVLILVGGFILGFFGWDDFLACEGFFEFFFSVV